MKTFSVFFTLLALTFFSVDPPQDHLEAAPESYVSAKKMSEAGCGSGTFFDLIDGGTCWACPAGFERSTSSVKGSKACVKKGKTLYAKASDHGKGWGILGTNCDPGEFWDPNGRCYSCPKGYSRTAHAVTSSKACVKTTKSSHSEAVYRGGANSCGAGTFYDPIDGGTCWKCPSGYGRTVYPVDGPKACQRQ